MRFNSLLFARWRALAIIALVGAVAVIGITQAFEGGYSSADEGVRRVRPLTPDERLEQIAKENPGFGGLFRDPDDKSIVTVFMTDVSKREIAERAARASVSDPESIREVRIVQADFAFTGLAVWYRQITKHMWAAVDEVKEASISEETNRIEIGLSDLSARDKVIKVLNELGIPMDAVRIKKAGVWELL
jgi:hypothetical protein